MIQQQEYELWVQAAKDRGQVFRTLSRASVFSRWAISMASREPNLGGLTVERVVIEGDSALVGPEGEVGARIDAVDCPADRWNQEATWDEAAHWVAGAVGGTRTAPDWVLAWGVDAGGEVAYCLLGLETTFLDRGQVEEIVADFPEYLDWIEDREEYLSFWALTTDLLPDDPIRTQIETRLRAEWPEVSDQLRAILAAGARAWPNEWTDRGDPTVKRGWAVVREPEEEAPVTIDFFDPDEQTETGWPGWISGGVLYYVADGDRGHAWEGGRPNPEAAWYYFSPYPVEGAPPSRGSGDHPLAIPPFGPEPTAELSLSETETADRD